MFTYYVITDTEHGPEFVIGTDIRKDAHTFAQPESIRNPNHKYLIVNTICWYEQEYYVLSKPADKSNVALTGNQRSAQQQTPADGISQQVPGVESKGERYKQWVLRQRSRRR